MKKLLSLFAVSSIVSPIFSTTTLSSYLKTTNENLWDNVGIDHHVTTPPTGTHDRDNDQNSSFSSNTIDWNILSSDEQITANGKFQLKTYKEPKYLNFMTLTMKSSETNKVVWYDKEVNDKTSGLWAHQTSFVELTLTANYLPSTKTTSLFLVSHVHARTAGSVHSCQSWSKVTDLQY